MDKSDIVTSNTVFSTSEIDEKSVGEKLCEALKIFISNRSIRTFRVLNNHPISLKAYIRVIGGFIESSIETQYNIQEANKDDNIPINIDEAWEYLTQNPDLAEKYIKDIPKSDYVFFSREILLESVN